MPLPAPPTFKPDNATNRRAKSRAGNELLIKGILCAVIGAVILLAPHVARSSGVQELMGSVYLVGWFSLALGFAIVGLGVRRHLTASPGR